MREFALGFLYPLCQSWVMAQVDLLGIVGTTGKRRVDIDQVHLDAPIFQIGTGGHAVAAHHHILVWVFADGFFAHHVVFHHAALNDGYYITVSTIVELSAGANKVAKHGLTFQRCIEWDIFDCHILICLFQFEKSFDGVSCLCLQLIEVLIVLLGLQIEVVELWQSLAVAV